MNEVFLVYAVVLLLAWPLGRYLALVHASTPTRLDRVFGSLEHAVYRAMGIDPAARMGWAAYGKALLELHLVIALIAFAILMLQGWLPLNPDGIPGMDWDLALHTTAAFITNTNQQHYAGQAQLSYFAQLFAVVAMQVITPAAGIAALVAILRTLLGPEGAQSRTASGDVAVGHFYVDLVRTIVRLLLPLAFVTALLLAWQGVPSTFEGARVIQPLDESAVAEQRIPVGPVAPMVAIKQLGTNGGGWYGANSAVPMENPTPVSNLVETVAILLIPVALLVTAAYLTGQRRLALSIFAVMLVLSASLSGPAIWSENQPNAAFAGIAAEGPNLEGKEVRFGATATALWGSLTTQTSNGSVSGMLDSFNPLGGLAALMGMFINATFGGVGIGLINYLLFLLLAAFLGSLMVGRSPEFLGRSIEAKEMKLISIALLLQPLLILSLTAVAVTVPGLAQTSNPGFHGLSQILYEYSSAYANNGSGLEGLGDDTPWWNLSCALALILGRFIPILAPLAIAAAMAGKRVAPTTSGSLNVATPSFAVLTLGVILMFALLSFFPALALGPVAEQLGLAP
ncbi:potassium-transporting ATPase subunit KdpA [Thiocapsa roseopersicina]|uniref:Potassium-transporting ATPase potassium-binding subunit n=1 Tax=Thiocapsa roseopersicina TaxID=1058 RepID=A0A1H2VI84_THIRO|nr:potassium-transporting ATPase subunit KdpA [Thiocapsa roseopersicina]SDW67609.1 K+-transporting ATPase ATPase A chain [Thiocapsa roseopersicina]